MALTLYIHPLASFCHKVLIAFYENEVPFTAETVDLMNPGEAAEHLARWPVGKIPVLYDGERDRIVAETSVIIEYVGERCPGPVPMLPGDAEARLEARLWDRFFDLYVSQPVQKIVTDRIRPEGRNDPHGVAEARRTLETAYAMIEQHMAGHGLAARLSPWPTARRCPACSSPASCSRFRRVPPTYRPISSGCWRGLR